MGTQSTWITPTVKQTWAVTPVLLTKFSLGMSLGFTSCLLNAIEDPNSTIKMNLNTASWFVSLLGMSMLVGFFTSSCLMYRFGRRMSAIINSLPAICSLVIITLYENVAALMAVRFLTGVSIGAYCIFMCVVIGEFTSPQNRGMFINMTTAALNCGSLLMHVMGHFTGWKALAVVTPAPYVVCLVITYTWPESPSWLAERHEYEKCREAFYWLRGRTEETTREIEELIRAQSHKVVVKWSVRDNVIGFFGKFKKTNFLKPFLIVVSCLVLLETSGRHIFPAYAAQLLQGIMSKGFDTFYLTIVIDVLIAISSFISTYLITVMKVRTLLLGSGWIAFSMLVAASVSLCFLNNGVLSREYSYVSLVLYILYFVISALGCSCVPLVLMGELYPLEHRVVGPALSNYILLFIMTVTLKVMPILVAAFNMDGAFGILGGCMALMLTALHFILPETKDRTLQEIEHYFSHGKFIEGTLVPTEDIHTDDKLL